MNVADPRAKTVQATRDTLLAYGIGDTSMTIMRDTNTSWGFVATIEVIEAMHQPMELLYHVSGRFRVDPASVSPAGCRWFHVYVDYGLGEVIARRIAQSVLSALQRCADDRLLRHYRVVVGREWLAPEELPWGNAVALDAAASHLLPVT
jgi:hypothetical protein